MKPTDAIQVRPLQPHDAPEIFRSGHIELDRYFHRYAGQNQFRHHIGTTYVAITQNRILGYATVSAGHLESTTMSATLRKRLPEYPLPVLRIARLAIAQDCQRQGIGLLLLRAMFELALDLRDRVGCVGVVVDAKPKALAFYERLGFIPLAVEQGALGARPEPRPLFLSIKTISQAI